MRLFYFIASVLFLVPAPAPASGDVYSRISWIEGSVQISGPDQTEWTDAETNMPLAESDRLWIHEDAKAELQLTGGFYLRADEKTSLDVLSLDSGSIQFYLDQGHAYINNLRGGIKVVQIDTPLSSVRSYDNSIMMLDIAEDGTTEVSVLKGYVTAENRAGATRVGEGNTLTINGSGEATLSPLGPSDDWESWNRERDRHLLAWGESARYLPGELQEYSSDFDGNGRWVYVQEYGYCWTPVITVSAWSPYSVGRWAWFRGNYVWVSSEPWGWVPYHYGRWAWVSGFGWCWVPPIAGAVYWGPGYVGWIGTPDSLAWVPLAPGEVYYGYGYYGPGSVNITTVHVDTIVVHRHYRNVRVQNSVSVVGRGELGQIRSRLRKVRDEENPFLHSKPSGPDLLPPRVIPGTLIHRPAHEQPQERRERTGQPERTEVRQEERRQRERRITTAPQPAPGAMVQERRQPPDRVKQIRPEEIKSQRKLVREKDASAFRSERPADLSVRKNTEPKVINRKPAVQQQQQQKKKERERRSGRER